MTEQEIINRALELLEARLHKPDFYVKDPRSANEYLKLQFAELEYESFRVLFLNNQHVLNDNYPDRSG